MAQPFVFVSPGPCYISYDAEDLGIAEDRVEIQVTPYFEDIHTDAAGGLAGPFHERQFLGAVAQINAVLTKYDDDAMKDLATFNSPTGALWGGGANLPVGTFIYQDNEFGTLIINGVTDTIQFDYAHLAMAVGFNYSVRHKRWQVGFLARVDQFCYPAVLAEYIAAVSCVE